MNVIGSDAAQNITALATFVTSVGTLLAVVLAHRGTRSQIAERAEGLSGQITNEAGGLATQVAELHACIDALGAPVADKAAAGE